MCTAEHPPPSSAAPVGGLAAWDARRGVCRACGGAGQSQAGKTQTIEGCHQHRLVRDRRRHLEVGDPCGVPATCVHESGRGSGEKGLPRALQLIPDKPLRPRKRSWHLISHPDASPVLHVLHHFASRTCLLEPPGRTDCRLGSLHRYARTALVLCQHQEPVSTSQLRPASCRFPRKELEAAAVRSITQEELVAFFEARESRGCLRGLSF